MEFNSFSGYYSPSLYKITLRTNEPINQITNLPPELLSTFFHEYFHFIQDVTSAFGISQAWNFYNRTRQMLAYVQNSADDVIYLPLSKDPNMKDIVDYFEIQKENIGDWDVNGLNQEGEFEIVEMALLEDTITSKYESNIKYPYLTIKSIKDGTNYNYRFGAVAIIESMTTLIQDKFFEKKDLNDFPYRAVNRLIQFRFPNQKIVDEVIFSLCDVALLSPYPAMALYEMLDLFHELPSNGEDIYEVGMIYIDSKWKIWQFYEHQLGGLSGSINELYSTDFFKNDVLWFSCVITKGFEIRRNDNMFLLRLFRESNAFDNKVMNKIKYELGAPEVINFLNDRWFSAPFELKKIEDRINTLFLTVYEKLHDFLLFGNINDAITGEQNRHCRLKNHCQGSSRKMPIDQNCIDAPWKKAESLPLCPFGLVYFINGLTKKKFDFK